MATTPSTPSLTRPRRNATYNGPATNPTGQAMVNWVGGQPDQWAEHVPELIWPYSIPVYSAMATDPQVRASLRAIIGPLLDASWHLDPGGASPEVVQFCAENIALPVLGAKGSFRPVRGAINFDAHLRVALEQSLVQGHAFFNRWFEPRMVGDTMQLRLANPSFRPAPSITQIHSALNGDLLGITQFVHPDAAPKQTSFGGVFIGAEALIPWVHEPVPGDWSGTSLLRAAWKPWFLKDQALRIGMIGLDRAGVGVPWMKHDGQPGSKEAAEEIVTAVRAGDDAGVTLPPGWEFGLMGSEGTTVDPKPWVDYFDQQIAKSVLAMFLDLGHDNGARALGDTFAGHLMLLVNQIRKWVEQTVTDHLLQPLVAANFGADAIYPVLRAPRLEAEQSVTPQLVAELIKAGALTWTPTLEAQLRMFLRLTDEDVTVLAEARRVAAASAPAPFGNDPATTMSAKKRRGAPGQQALFDDRSLEGLSVRLDALRPH